ncbi:hypothetical protein OG828_33395 [Streptomyces sp. NBC_00457]|uniref:hypothetical protein n=1 Tax=Streptomyces sp. NBC_00457 TaxID=2975748 RepID=UPI002E2157B8
MVARPDAEVKQPGLEVRLLGELVAGIVQRVGHPVEFDWGNDATLVRTDARRLERMPTNLVVNAGRHGNGPVEVGVKERRVMAGDHGGRIPERLLREGPMRFLTGRPSRERRQG